MPVKSAFGGWQGLLMSLSALHAHCALSTAAIPASILKASRLPNNRAFPHEPSNGELCFTPPPKTSTLSPAIHDEGFTWLAPEHIFTKRVTVVIVSEGR
jgi:hypothetical protein